MNGWDIVKALWNRGSGDYVGIATIDRIENGRFTQALLGKDKIAYQGVLYAEYRDQYFTPMTFKSGAEGRTNENAAPGRVFFADLDEAKEHEELPATFLWETSPGSLQGAWIVDQDPDLDEWADVNKRLTYMLGADSGGWPASKLLRVPGTLNWKRESEHFVPRGRILRAAPDTFYTWTQFRAIVRYHSAGMTERVEPLSRPTPEVLATERAAAELHKVWDQLSLGTKAQLMKATVNDRSRHIVRVLHRLREDGVSPEAAFHIIYVRPWNKWRGRANQLWREVQMVFEKSPV